MLIGGFLGHLGTPPTTGAEQVLPVPTVTATGGTNSAQLPDLSGLELAAARRVLSDAGIRVGITTETKEYAGPAGLVIGQSPAAGSPPADLILTLSRGAAMPQLSGKTRDQAVEALAALGAVTRIEQVVDPSVRADVVIGTEPRAGRPLGLLATVSVASEGEGLPFDKVKATDSSGCSRNSSRATVGGTEVIATIVCTPGVSRPVFVEYALRKKTAYLASTMGLDDGAPAGRVTVRAIVNGKPAASWVVTSDRAVPIHLATGGANRVRLEVVLSSPTYGPRLIFGDGRFVGRPADLDVLEEVS